MPRANSANQAVQEVRLLYETKDSARSSKMPIRKMVAMIKKYLAPGIIVYSDVMSLEYDLSQAIEDSASSGIVSWKEGRVRSSDTGDQIDKGYRDTLVIAVPYKENPQEDLSSPLSSFETTLQVEFFKAFDSIEKEYMSTFGFFTKWHDSYQILKYGVGQKFNNHVDDHEVYHRRISSIYYLNDSYEGGEINFPRFNITYKPKANDMLLFPSNYVYNHSVSEVTSGTRYAVVSWMT